MENNQNYYTLPEEQKIDIRSYLYKILRFWYLFPISLFTTILIANFINKYTEPQYEVASTMLISDDSWNNKNARDNFLPGFELFSGYKNFQNEMLIVTSARLRKKAAQRMNLEVLYYKQERFKSLELYKEAPFIVEFDSNHDQPLSFKFILRFISENKFHIEGSAEGVTPFNFSTRESGDRLSKLILNSDYAIGEVIISDAYSFKIIPSETKITFSTLDYDYYFVFNNVYEYVPPAISYTQVIEAASIVEYKTTMNHVNKAKDYLEEIANVYIEREIANKNKTSISTIAFIEEQIAIISDSLRQTERQLLEFRRINNVLDIEAQSSELMSEVFNLDNQKTLLYVKLKYYTYLDDYIKRSKDLKSIIAPATLGIDDLLLSKLITQLIDLVDERESLIFSSNLKSPLIVELDKKIDKIKNTILESIKNVVYAININLTDIETRIGTKSDMIVNIPKTQQMLVNLERKYNLNESIFTFFLEKQSEAQIAKAATVAQNEVVDPPRLVGQKQPKEKKNLSTAFLLGILIPIGFVFLKEMLNDKIIDRQEVEKNT
ncbi:MAG: hypothetical protein HOG05_09980, partial [Bacteroidetes bacterium]|nr:hypothetical protein [Bacteroidota bacterium]